MVGILTKPVRIGRWGVVSARNPSDTIAGVARRMADLLKVDTLFHLLPIGAYRSLPNGKQLRANRALVALNGYDSEPEFLRAVGDIATEWYVDPHRRDQFVELLMRDGRVVDFVSEVYRHRTRERIWVSENAHVVTAEDGRVLCFEGTVEDITARVRASQALSDSERRFRALTEKAQVGTAIVDAQGVVLYANPFCEALFGIPPDRFIGTNVFDSMHPDDVTEHRAEFAAVQAGTNTGHESIARHRGPDGRYRHLASLAKDYRSDPAIGGIVINWRDVTESREAEAQLRVLATTDPLTGLLNRREFERVVKARLAAAPGERLVLLYIDVNRFKLINDSLGHLTGDEALIRLADRMRSHVREGEVLARLGGDEFGVLAPAPDRHAGRAVAERMLSATAAPLKVGSLQVELGASVGAAYFPEDAQNFSDLLSAADLAMYRAKERPGSRVACYEPIMSERLREQLHLAQALHAALERGEIGVAYQPIVDVGSGAWFGFEALARWRHPGRGLLDAAQFIGLAEDHGQIAALGQQVAETAIAQLGAWHRAGHEEIRLTLNVSPLQIRDADFVDMIAAQIGRQGVPAKRLFVEITESALAGSDGQSLEAIERLTRLGVRIILDDIGTGYASFAQLKRFHVDVIKVDRSYVQGLPTRRVDRAIVSALAAMADALGIRVVAEGVEREDQLEFLRGVGIGAAQGFLFSRPLDAEVATARLSGLASGQRR
jgi:diguanylate cyclase (GGDEF)-like protein/PAS domain S-box-containing protein